MPNNPKTLLAIQIVSDTVQRAQRRQALQQLARMLCSQLMIPETSERVLPLTLHPARTNVEAVMHWLEAQIPDPRLQIDSELLPMLVALLRRKLASLENC